MTMATATRCHIVRGPVPRRFPKLFTTLLLLLKVSFGFTPPKKNDSQPRPDGSGGTQHDLKRITIAATLAIVPFLGWRAHDPIMAPPPAHALQEKNEVLCSTGFFTNVGAWYCTDIGNIGDEGKPKPLSGDAETSVDLLMGKFDLTEGDSSTKVDKNGDQSKENFENKETAKVTKKN